MEINNRAEALIVDVDLGNRNELAEDIQQINLKTSRLEREIRLLKETLHSAEQQGKQLLYMLFGYILLF